MTYLIATSIESAETIQHLTGSGLFGVFVLLLLVIAMEKWTSYQAQKDRLKAEQSRLDKNENILAESRKLESDSRNKLADALNNVASLTAVNSEKIDQMAADLTVVADKVGEHTERIKEHTAQIKSLRKLHAEDHTDEEVRS